MNDEIITANQIFYQDIVYDVVFNSPHNSDDVYLYNKVCDIIEIEDLDMLGMIMALIHLNQEIYDDGTPVYDDNGNIVK